METLKQVLEQEPVSPRQGLRRWPVSPPSSSCVDLGEHTLFGRMLGKPPLRSYPLHAPRWKAENHLRSTLPCERIMTFTTRPHTGNVHGLTKQERQAARRA